AHLFAPKDDKAITLSKKDKKGDKGTKPTDIAAIRKQGFVKIDFNRIGDRVMMVPIKTGNYSSLFVTPTHFIVYDNGASFLGRETGEQSLVAFDIDKRKTKSLISGVQSYTASLDRSRILVRTKKGLSTIDISKGTDKIEPKPLPKKGLKARIIPKQEWVTIFDEVWRRFRDYFYVSNMHGFDWKAIRDRYRPLAQRVEHREELNDVLGQMIAELEVSHAYVSGGDLGIPSRPSIALLGARFTLDKKNGRYQISRIYKGHNEEANYRSPLTEVGVGARVGDYVLEINGQSLRADDNPYRLLRDAMKQPVELTLNRRPTDRGARRVMVKPIASEASLEYLDWILNNRAHVDSKTNGKIGYLHIPDMGSNGIREFLKWYIPQARKEGLIVDVRSNGGGFVSQLIIERLRRRVLGTGYSRHSKYVDTYPYAAVTGPMVCLMNETSASDGDIFPWAFRASGLGPLIGKKSWGGVVGITNHGPVLDGGSVFVPQFSTNDAEGAYIIEGEGVTPDIEVDNDPVSVASGKDPQLTRAIDEVLKRHGKTKRLPKRPPPPNHRQPAK
ncbi:MAG: S41 family peptidase, partial [Myxococcota bacterium]